VWSTFELLPVRRLHHLFDAGPLGLAQQGEHALLLGDARDLWFVGLQQRLGGGRGGRDLAPSCRVGFDAPLLGCGRENRKAMKSARADRSANSFEVVAREWFAKYSATWAANHGNRIIRRFERDIFPWIGGRPIADVAAPELLAVVRRIENRGALETAHRALGNCGQVFRYAVATGRAMRDPCGDLRGALPPVKGEHFATAPEVSAKARCFDEMPCLMPLAWRVRFDAALEILQAIGQSNDPFIAPGSQGQG
jgi:hypothetical protein